MQRHKRRCATFTTTALLHKRDYQLCGGIRTFLEQKVPAVQPVALHMRRVFLNVYQCPCGYEFILHCLKVEYRAAYIPQYRAGICLQNRLHTPAHDIGVYLCQSRARSGMAAAEHTRYDTIDDARRRLQRHGVHVSPQPFECGKRVAGKSGHQYQTEKAVSLLLLACLCQLDGERTGKRCPQQTVRCTRRHVVVNIAYQQTFQLHIPQLKMSWIAQHMHIAVWSQPLGNGGKSLSGSVQSGQYEQVCQAGIGSMQGRARAHGGWQKAAGGNNIDITKTDSGELRRQENSQREGGQRRGRRQRKKTLREA